MKRLFYSAALFIGILAASCGNRKTDVTNSNANASTDNTTSGSAIASPDEGSYAFKVAGKEVNEKGTKNFGYKADVSSDKKELHLVLTNASSTDGTVSSFLFSIPNKIGATTFTKENDHLNNADFFCTYTGSDNLGSDNNPKPMIDNITITVEQLSDKRVSGNFSGTVVGKDGSTLRVTDGRFNLPVILH